MYCALFYRKRPGAVNPFFYGYVSRNLLIVLCSLLSTGCSFSQEKLPVLAKHIT